MGKYNFDPLEEYFLEWFSPSELVGILRRIGMNMAISGIQSSLSSTEIKDDLEDLKMFISYLERTSAIPHE